MKPTYASADGFNLYDRALSKTKYKWREVLVKGLFDADNEIQCARHFAEPAGWKPDPGQSIGQQRSLEALSATPCMSFDQGQLPFPQKARKTPSLRKELAALF